MMFLLGWFLVRKWSRTHPLPLLAAIGVNSVPDYLVSIRTNSEASAQLNQNRLQPLDNISHLSEPKEE
jgi:hypothetical protein